MLDVVSGLGRLQGLITAVTAAEPGATSRLLSPRVSALIGPLAQPASAARSFSACVGGTGMCCPVMTAAP